MRKENTRARCQICGKFIGRLSETVRFGPQARILTAVIERYPAEITKEDLASSTGYTAGGGGFNNLVGSLRSLEMIDYPRPGVVIARSVLFPEGLK